MVALLPNNLFLPSGHHVENKPTRAKGSWITRGLLYRNQRKIYASHLLFSFKSLWSWCSAWANSWSTKSSAFTLISFFYLEWKWVKLKLEKREDEEELYLVGACWGSWLIKHLKSNFRILVLIVFVGTSMFSLGTSTLDRAIIQAYNVDFRLAWVVFCSTTPIDDLGVGKKSSAEKKKTEHFFRFGTICNLILFGWN